MKVPTLVACVLCAIMTCGVVSAAEDEGLVGEWLFESKAGSANSPAVVDDGVGKAGLFDGKDSFVDGGNDAKLDLRTQITLEAWVYPIDPKSGVGEPLILGKGIYSYGLVYNPGQAWFYISDGAWNCVADIPTKQWTHVAGTYDGNVMKLYINGRMYSSYTMADPNTPIKQPQALWNSKGSVYLGRRLDAHFNGMIDQARIHDRALSAQQITAHYKMEKKLLKVPPPIKRESLTGLALKVFDAGKSRRTLLVDSIETIKTNLIVPANITLKFQGEGMCKVGSGATLRHQGPIDAPRWRIFSGAGKVILNPAHVENVYPQWFGAIADDGKNDAPAIQAAVYALPTGGVVCIPRGRYEIGATLKIHSNMALIGGIGQAVFHATKPLPALIQRPDTTPPPDGIHYNSTTRVDGVRLENLRFVGENSAIGLDFTNMNYLWVENVSVTNCKTGIMLAELGMYDTFIRPNVARCDVGIEVNIGVMNNNIFGGIIAVCKTGILVNVASQLNLYGMTFDLCTEYSVDVKRGDGINLHYPWFDSIESSVPVRIGPGVSGCSVINPRFSGPTPKIIEDQSDGEAVVIINTNGEAKSTVRGKMLEGNGVYTRGLSATNSMANNLRGKVQLTDDDTTLEVTFDTTEPDADYFITATAVAAEGEPSAGAWTVHIADKTASGFTVALNSAPGSGAAVEVNWMLMR